MTPSLAVVWVHYRAPHLLAGAARSWSAQAAAAGFAVEAVIVDNSGDAPDELAESGAVRLLRPGENLGYAGGLGVGVEATTAPMLILANPDVLPQEGCLAALLSALQAGAAVAGPQFVWDERGRFLLPPTEERTLAAQRWARLAFRGESWRRRAARRWRAHARRHWCAGAATGTVSLSGALLAVQRDAWRRVGPMDVGFRLYFEECDWLARLERAGLRSVLVPAARAWHRHAVSTRLEPRAAEWFARSERRFARRWYGTLGRFLIGAAAPSESRLPWPARGRSRPSAPEHTRGDLWLELSPSPRGFPAAAQRLPADEVAAWQPPPELLDELRTTRYRWAVVDDRGDELAAGPLEV